MDDAPASDGSHGDDPEAPAPPDGKTAATRAFLTERRRLLEAELQELARPVRSPGAQMQFGKRAGDHTADAVAEMTRSLTAGELRQVLDEIARALEKLAEGSYGICDSCGLDMPPARLQAIPWANRCVACQSGRATPGRLGRLDKE